MTRTTPRQANYARHLRPYLEEVPEAYRDLLRLAQGQALRLAAAAPPAPPPPGVGPRPLRYDIVDALNAGLKRLGPLHAVGRRAIGALVRCCRLWLGGKR
jgi:hypothetical protein